MAEFNLVEDITNKLQEINQRVPGVGVCPLLADYPENIDGILTPSVLSDLQTWDWVGAGDYFEGVMTFTIISFWERIGEGVIGLSKSHIAQAQAGMAQTYLDEDNGIYVTGKILVAEPFTATILQDPRPQMSGYELFQYPEDSGFWFRGFTLDLSILVEWPVECIPRGH